MKTVNKVFSTILLFLGILVFFGCEIGLGSAVDTEAPVFEIRYPKDAAVIRDSFRLGGTWSDDGTINSVTVELSRPDSYGKVESYAATVKQADNEGEENTWFIVIDPKNSEKRLVDGTYVASVTFEDDGGHRTEKSCQFTIDNTPPVVVLQKPSSKEDTAESEIDSYGQIFNIQGQSADDNNVEKIKVNFYSSPSCTEESFLYSVERENVPPTIDQDIATFGEDSYTKIYGSAEKNGTNNKIYCQIYAYDGARKYSVETGELEEDFGNVTNTYYRYNDIATTVLSENGLKVTDLYYMNSGYYELTASRTVGTGAAQETVSKINKLLENKAVKAGRFSLNPENNPSFTISGHSTFKKGNTDNLFENAVHNISNGSTVVMEVAVGLDGWPLNENVWFYLLPCDKTGKVTDEADKYYIDATRTPSGTSYKFVYTLSKSSVVYKESPYGKTDDQKKSVVSAKNLEIGQNYVIRIEGTDQQSNAVLANKSSLEEYAIHFASSGAAPIFSNVLPKETSIYKKLGSSVELSGDVSTEEGKPSVSVTCGEKTYSAVIEAKAKDIYSFKVNLPVEAFSQTESKQYDLKIIAKTDNETSIQKCVYYDTEGPKITLNKDSVTPVASRYTDENGTTDGKSYLNGQFTVKVIVDEAFDVIDLTTNRPKLQLIDESGKILWTEYLISNESFRRDTTIDSTKTNENGERIIPDGKTFIKITVWDRAGNESSQQVEFYVNQETDKPVVLPYSASSLTFTIDNEEKLNQTIVEGSANYKKNSYTIGSQMMLRIIDDDGIKNVSVYSSKESSAKPETYPAGTTYDSGNTEIIYTYNDISDKTGKYYCWVRITDINNTFSELGPFMVKVTTAAPVISAKSDKTYKPVNGYVTNTIDIESTEEPFILYEGTGADSESATWTNITQRDGVTYSNANNERKFTVQVSPDVTTKYWYYVQDVNKNDSNVTKVVEVKVDNAAPEEFKIVAPLAAETGKPANYVSGTSYSFSGSAKDEASGVSKLYYAFTDSSATPASWKEQAAVNGNWSISMNLGTNDSTHTSVNNTDDTLYEGHYWLHVKAEDAAGNVTGVINREFFVDQSNPSFSAYTVTETAGSSTKNGNTYYVKDTLTGTVDVTDANGITGLTYKIGNGTEADLISAGTYTGSWTISGFTANPEEAQTVTIIAKDAAGKTTEKTINVYKDTKAPEVTITKPVAGEIITNAAGASLSGTIFDNSGSGAETIEYTAAYDAAKTDAENGWTAITYTAGASSWNMPLAAFTEEGPQTAYIRAKDKLGNVTAVQSVTFNYDKTIPTLTVDTIGSYIKEGTLTLSGKAKDSNGLQKVVISYIDSSSAEQTVNLTGVAAGSRNVEKTWTKNFEVGSGKTLTDGSYTFTIIAVDAAGRESVSQTRTVTVDNAAPEELKIVAPLAAASEKPANYVSGTSYSFSGSAKDALAGIAKIYYAFTDSSAIPASWKEQAAVNGNWSISMNLGTNDSTHTSANNTDDTLYEGHYWLHVKAEDAAGNVTGVESREFFVDQSVPEVTATAPQYVNKSTNSGTRTVTLGGTITETNELSSFKIFRSGTAAAIKSFTIGSGNEIEKNPNAASWSFTDTAPADGTYTYKFVAKDASGKTNILLEKTVVVDVVDPTADLSKVTLPTAYETENSLFKFTGAAACVADSGTSSGFGKIEVAFTNDTTAPAAKNFEVTPASDGSWNSTVSFADYTVFGTQGTKYVWLKVTDKAGNTSGWVNGVSFVYDTATPSIELTSTTPSDGSYIKSGFTLEATATDTYGIENVKAVGKVIFSAAPANWATVYSKYMKDEACTTAASSTFTAGTYYYPVTLALASEKYAKAIAVTEIADGKYEFTVTAKDKSGKPASKKTGFTLDTKAPEMGTPGVTNANSDKHNVNGTTWYSNKTIKLSVSPTDTNGSGVNTVSYSTVSKATRTANDWTDLTNNGSGTFTGSIVFANDGTNVIYLRAVDKANNVTGEDDSQQMIFNIDTTKPSLSVTSTIPAYMGSSGFDISGTATDPTPSSGDVVLTIKEEHKNAGADDSTYAATAQSGASITVTNGNWSKKLPLSGTPEEGYYRYTLTLKDPAENTVSSTSYITRVDTTAPVLTITSPVPAQGKTSAFVNETYPKFTGTFTELIQINNVYYKFATSAPTVTQVSDLASWDKATMTGSSGTSVAWNFYQSFKTKGAAGQGIEEGAYTLYVYAVDEAGNISDSDSTSAGYQPYTINYMVDLVAPEVTATAPEYVNKSTDSGARTVVLSGTITETNELASFEIFRSGTVAAIKSFTIGSGNEIAKNPSAASWLYTDTAPADGTYKYTFVAKDASGKINTLCEKTVVVDVENPTADLSKVTLPTAYETENTLFKFTGSTACVADSGTSSGLDKLEVAFTNDASAPAAKDFEVTPASDGSWNSTVSFADYTAFGTQGTKYVWLKVTDKAGNTSGWVNKDSTGNARIFVYDTSVPIVSYTAPPAEGSYNNVTFTLSGTATDTYGVETVVVIAARKVTLSANPDAATWPTGYYTDSECKTAASAVYADGTYYYKTDFTQSLSGATAQSKTWSQTITLAAEQSGNGNTLPDGEYTFTAKVTDISGKTGTTKHTLTIDTTKPTGSFDSSKFSPLKKITENSRDWYGQKAITFSVAINDANISSVEGSSDGSNFSGFSPNNGNYAGTLTGLEEGKNTITVKMTDKAGNTNTINTTIYVDNVAPSQDSIMAYIAESAIAANKIEDSKLTNQRSDLVIYVDVKDENYKLDTKPSDWDTDCTSYYTDAACKTSVSANTTFVANTYYKLASTGIASVKFGDTTAVKQASGLYKLTIPKTSQSGKVNLTIFDNAGNKAVLSPFTFNSDTSKPEVTITAVKDADTSTTGTQVNKTITFEGTAKDNQLKQIDVCCYVNNAWKNIYSTISNPAVWSTTIDTTSTGPFGSLTDGTEVILCVIATDAAGNRNIDTGSGSTAVDVTKLDSGKVIPDSTKIAVSSIAAANKCSIIVNQDTDRPVITFTNLSLGASLSSSTYIPFENNVVYGNIIDDDGLGTTAGDIQYKTDKITWTNLSVSNGSFKISGLDDGQRSIQFKIKDSGGTTFESNGTDTPKLSDGTNTYSNISELKLKVDTIAPYVESSVQYTRDVSGTPIWSIGIANAVFGGTQNKLYLNQFAYDANGIQGSAVLIPIDSNDTGVVTTNISGYGWTTADGSATVYTNENSLTANTSKYYSDIACKIEEGNITAVDTTHGTITADGKTYSKAYYRYAWNKVASSTHSGVYTYEEWRSPEIDVTGMATGSRTAIVEVSDGIRTTKSTLPLVIDNTSPVVSLSQPSATQYSSGNITAYGTIDSATNMYYALSLDNSTTPGADDTHKGTTITTWNGLNVTTEAATSGTASYAPYYQPVNGFGIQWFVYFDGGQTTSLASHDVSFKQFLIDSGVTTAVNIQNKSFTDIVNAYLWIKAVDVAGNTTVEKYPVLIDPQGDAPALTIDYPEADGTTLGGAVSLRGTATDTVGTNIGIDNVWVQIISAKENGYTSSNATQTHTTGGFKFTDTVTTSVVNAETTYTHTYKLNSFAPTMKDVKQWYDNGYEVWSDITGTPVKLTSSPTASQSSGAAYYIKATFSGSAWTLKINEQNEFDPVAGTINPVAYRVCAVDKDKTISKAQIGFSVFDSDLPVISNVYLRQYSDNDNGTGTVSASREYSDDMWVKGTWWLCGEAKDTQGLNSLKVAGNSINTITKTANATETFRYKLASGTGVGKLSIEIEAEDNATPKKHSTIKECVINYDNVEPSLVTSGSAFNISSTIQNSNGFHSFGSQVVEAPVGTAAQSGFKYLAFWYERNISGGKHVVYDVMRPKTKAAPTDTYLRSEVNWADVTNDSGLMWKTKTVTRSAAALGTLTLSATDANIHVGGLCKIGGSIYMISSVSGTTIGIDGQPEMPSGATTQTAYFAIANVVNNTIEAGTGTKSTVDGKYGYYDSVSNDDGDHMVESVQKSGTTWTWEANINSQNIPDGAVTLHYVAFDAAGNYTEGTAAANVSNNAPRLASLKVWSDFNENSTMDEGEYETYYYNGKERKIGGAYVERATKVTDTLVVSGNKKDYTDGGSAFMTVKAATTFKPEVVGGNGALYYSYKAGNASGLASATPTIGASSLGTGQDDGIDEEVDANGYYKADDNEMGYISGQELTISDLDATKLNSLGNSTSAAAPTWFEYTIYDSTEGSDATWNTSTLSTTNRLSATFRVALNVQYQDSTKPNAWIRPFYWKKTGKPDSGTDLYNSLEWDSTGKIPQGHIELEDDLTTEITTALGTEPKVSGIIKVEGYAFDDIKLKQLSVKFAGHSKLKDAQVASTYTGTWSTTAYNATNGWGFAANDVYCNGNGHLVHWVLTVDTAKQANVADKDKAFEIIAKDARGNSGSGLTSDASTTQTALTTYLWGTVKSEVNAGSTYFTDPCCYTAVNNSTGDNTVVYKESTSMTPYYKVDIVPYITSIQTTNRAKSGLKDNNIRSASGKYSIIKGTEANFITVNGFNLNPTNVRIVSSSDVTGTITRASGNPVTFGTVSSDYTSVGLKNDGSKSGYLELFVNGIRTLNNINNNDSKGSFVLTGGTKQAPVATVYDYENMPNREADYNITKNVQLTDDRYIRFFDMKDTGMENGYYPNMIMKGDNPVFGYINKSGGNSGTPTSKGIDTYAGSYSPSHAMPQRSEFNGNSAIKVYTEYLIKASTWDQMGMAVDEGGRYYNVSVYNRDGAAMSLVYDRYAELYGSQGYGWGSGTGYYGYPNGTNNEYWSHGSGNNAITLDGVGYRSILQTERYQYPKILAKGNSKTGTAYIYMLYYDDALKELCFRNFQIGKTVSGTPKSLDSTHKDQDNNTYEQKINFSENTDYASTAAEGRLSITTEGSQYYTISVTSDNHVIVAWYSNTDSKLKLAYSNNAVTGNNPTAAVSWTTSTVDFPNYVGNYVSMALDSSDGIHISAFDANDSDLYYMYLPSYDSSDLTKIRIDQQGSVGNWTQIKVKNDVPYIAYYNSTETGGRDSIKLAWANSAAGSITAGVDSNNYTTGAWEYMTVPAITPPQGGDPKFQNVCLDFDSAGRPVVGYLGTNLEFGKALDE